jgi:LPPG:FO 2-phospho-L-lactate transferase
VRKVIALAGGVGAAKLLRGLIKVVNPKDLVIVGNTGDDTEFHGLHVSPDLDIVMYTLAGIVDEKKGWGISKDTYKCLNMMEKLGLETWFKLGDSDLAFQIARSNMLKEGLTLTEVTDSFCQKLGIIARLVPMSDYPVRTKIISSQTVFDFQEYFVKHGTAPVVTDVFYEGADEAILAPIITEALEDLERIIFCPSNPILSIAPILAISDFREQIRRARVPKIGISPIVGGRALKGPADRIMMTMGLEATAYGVARFYQGLMDHFIIDTVDEHQRTLIEDLGFTVTVTDTIMTTLEDSIRLSELVMEIQ